MIELTAEWDAALILPAAARCYRSGLRSGGQMGILIKPRFAPCANLDSRQA
jgi:hypothetical protein